MGAFDHLIPSSQSNAGASLGKTNSFDHLIPEENKSSTIGNLGLGLARGARDLIDGPAYLVPKGIEKLASAAGIDSVRDWAASEAQRVSSINQDAENQYQSMTPGSAIAGAGRVGANVLGAFLPGTGQTKAATAIKGMVDRGEKLKAISAISALGAAQNAVLNTKTEDDNFISNAAIGSVSAPVGHVTVTGASNAIQGARNAIAGADGRVGRVLSNASQISPDELAASISNGNKSFVQGANPTTSQAAMNPGISQLDRTIRNHGYMPLVENDVAQNSARISALDAISPGASNVTSAEAAYNAGMAIKSDAATIRNDLQKEIRSLYDNQDLQSASINYPNPNLLKEAIDRFYPGAAFQEAPADLKRVISAISSVDGPASFKEFDAFRKILGNRSNDLYQTDKTASTAFGAIKDLFDKAQDSAIESAKTKLSETGRGEFGPIYGNLSGDPKNAIAHLLKTGSGEVPAASIHPQAGPIDLVAGNDDYGLLHIAGKGRDDALRALPELMTDGAWYGRPTNKTGTYLGNGVDEAAVRMDWDGGNKQWIPTAYEQYPHLKVNPETDRFSHLNSFTDGSTLPPSNGVNEQILSQNSQISNTDPRKYTGLMTEDQARTLAEARRLFGEKVDRFESGPSRAIFRSGSDGLPQRDGAQIASGFFNSSRSQSEDIAQLLKMLPKKSSGADSLRSYAISDLLEKASNTNGTISAPKLNSWIDSRRPAIDKLFFDDQKATLNNVMSDVSRQFNAESLGRVIGSNTAQNMIGESLLDTRIAGLVSRLFPYAGPAGLEAMRAYKKRGAVNEVGDAMLNPEVAMRALNVYQKLITPNVYQKALDSSTPALVPGMSSFGSSNN